MISRFIFITCLLSLNSFYLPLTTKPEQIFILSGPAQGTTFKIRYKAVHPLISFRAIDSLFNVYDRSLSKYNNYSLLYKLNKSSSKARIDNHLRKVLEYAELMYHQTGGTFDYKLQPIFHLWGFDKKALTPIPDSNKIKKLLQLKDHSKLIMKGMFAIKSSCSLGIDLDGIAQGYCVDQLASYLLSKGISNFIVELGGEIYVSGNDLNNQSWTIGVGSTDEIIGSNTSQWILRNMDQLAVTTSGSFQKFKRVGERYISHIIDPRTGYPVNNGIVTVTVIAPSAMQADALDNAFMVMGIEKSFEWLRGTSNLGLYITYINEDGQLTDTSNAYFKKYAQQVKLY